MGFRLHRSMKLFPGVRLNLSKSGLGLSLGAPGARISLNPKYGARATVGIPGTGLSYSQKIGGVKRKSTPRTSRKASAAPVVTCPQCSQQQHIPAHCTPNTTLICARCQQQFTPPLDLFVDHEGALPDADSAAPREVHLVLFSPLGEEQLTQDDPTDIALEEYLEKMPVGDGSRLALISQYGFVQAFRADARTYRLEWRNRHGENRYASQQPLVTVVRVFQNYANNHDILRDIRWNVWGG